jgi:hypothetical protein
MAIRIRNALLLFVLFAGLLSNPPDLSSCGPFLPTAAFSVKSNPSHPRGPEALHLAVRAVRYGGGAKAGRCTDSVSIATREIPGLRVGQEDQVLVLRRGPNFRRLRRLQSRPAIRGQ